jgi:4'-phosphopantetheinyl transferase
MPIVHQRKFSADSALAVWQIEEPEEWFLEKLQLQEAELAEFSVIKGERRREWLAGRQLAWDLSGHHQRPVLFKDQYGKPHLQGLPLHFSLSHTHQYVAAVMGPQLTGIDIQVLVAKIERIVPKFLHEEEQAFISTEHRLAQLHVCWGAKEAMYKAYGQRELTLRSDILIEPFAYQSSGGLARGLVSKGDYERRFDLVYELRGECMLVTAWG